MSHKCEKMCDEIMSFPHWCDDNHSIGQGAVFHLYQCEKKSDDIMSFSKTCDDKWCISHWATYSLYICMKNNGGDSVCVCVS